jgi:GxxExxY protein
MKVFYERALAIELRRRGYAVAVQQSFPVFYRAELIGTLVPDLIVNSSVFSAVLPVRSLSASA